MTSAPHPARPRLESVKSVSNPCPIHPLSSSSSPSSSSSSLLSSSSPWLMICRKGGGEGRGRSPERSAEFERGRAQPTTLTGPPSAQCRCRPPCGLQGGPDPTPHAARAPHRACLLPPAPPDAHAHCLGITVGRGIGDKKISWSGELTSSPGSMRPSVSAMRALSTLDIICPHSERVAREGRRPSTSSASCLRVQQTRAASRAGGEGSRAGGRAGSAQR